MWQDAQSEKVDFWVEGLYLKRWAEAKASERLKYRFERNVGTRRSRQRSVRSFKLGENERIIAERQLERVCKKTRQEQSSGQDENAERRTASGKGEHGQQRVEACKAGKLQNGGEKIQEWQQ